MYTEKAYDDSLFKCFEELRSYKPLARFNLMIMLIETNTSMHFCRPKR